jgi:hypothetical protein
MVFARKSNWTPEDVKFLIEDEWTMQEIADHYGVTKQRIHQIRKKHNLPNPVALRRERRQKEYFDKWGTRVDTDLYSVCRSKFRAKKSNSKKLGLPWTLTFGELDWPERCPILGVTLDYFAESRMETSPSFDRIDPALGYVAGNVRIVSWRANRIKNDGSASEHRLIAEYIDKHAAPSSGVV